LARLNQTELISDPGGSPSCGQNEVILAQFLPASFTYWAAEKKLSDLNLFEEEDKSG